MDLQPVLENDYIIARPLKESDFDILFKAASDPLIWDQHPNKNRYKKPDFENFFKGAMESGGAFIVFSKETGEVIGSSRYYGYNEEERSIEIGYTFFSRENWGKNMNRNLKTVMLNHAFTFVDKVIFHIGAQNLRSQKSIEKLNARKTGEKIVEYFGESPKLNFVYEIDKKDWISGPEPDSDHR
ncbi:MAG: GNAT family N-acetyltransferase [Ginsengibacter sp.]